MKDNCNTVAVKSRRISRRRRILLGAFMVLMLWALLDVCVYICLTRVRRKFHIFRMPALPSNKRVERFAQEYFHPKWGWDIADEDKGRFGNRKGRHYGDKQIYKIKVFGDSFAYGDEVKSNETWENFIEESTGWECINFGVSAYGTDQALLKYLDNKIKTEYVILTIVDENIGRVVTSCWGFFGPRGIQTKPRFSISGDKSVVLIENPLKNVNDLKQMQDIDFFNKLAKEDYWCRYFAKMNMPRRPRWPATFLILSHGDFFIRVLKIHAGHRKGDSLESILARRKFYHLYDKGSEGLAIMRYLVDEFANTARSRGETPIIVLFPTLDTVTILKRFNTKPYSSLVEHLDTSGYSFIDFGDIFAKEDCAGYYHGHFSVKGNRRVTQVVAEYIERLEQEKENRQPVAARER